MDDLAKAGSDLAVPEGFRAVPMDRFIGANGPLYAKREGEGLVLGFRVELRHCNPADICHGGMLMTLADMLLGMGSNFQGKLGRFLPTVSMTTDFLAPAPLGAWVEGRTELLRTTRNLVFAQCLVTADGTLALRASGIMKQGQPFADAAAWAKLLG
ncbi:MAG TPA: PaaI family thioesterase [Aliidongia sp.]|nr:PaaI family thioesterase [Aliidongia sp.]